MITLNSPKETLERACREALERARQDLAETTSASLTEPAGDAAETIARALAWSGDATGARRYFAKAARWNERALVDAGPGDYGDLVIETAWLHWKAGQLQKALVTLDRLDDILQDDEDWYWILGPRAALLRALAGDREEATRLWETLDLPERAAHAEEEYVAVLLTALLGGERGKLATTAAALRAELEADGLLPWHANLIEFDLLELMEEGKAANR